jgi:hypothetical protein
MPESARDIVSAAQPPGEAAAVAALFRGQFLRWK